MEVIHRGTLFIFRSAYKVISPLIHPVTRDKIKILGGNQLIYQQCRKQGYR